MHFHQDHLSLSVLTPPALFIVVVRIIIDHVEEPQLVNPLAGRDHAQPVAELLLLQELFGPVPEKFVTSESARLSTTMTNSQVFQVSSRERDV